MGVNTMKAGGNAVDAAVSTTVCIGVVDMFSSGIGGGGFMTVRLPPSAPNDTSQVFTIDSRETAPALSNKTMYNNDPLAARWDGLAVGVPGELRGLEAAHRRWGSLPWKDLVNPVADLTNGWTVQPELERRIEMHSPLMLNAPDWQAVFAPDGQLRYSKSLYNYPEPGKRPLSSTTPTITENEDGSLYLAIGGSGGSRIFPTVFQVILNLDWGMDISAAIEHGRVHGQLIPNVVYADDILPVDLLDGLRDKGHNITVSDTGRVGAAIQGVLKLNDTIYAASDSRKDGIAAGC